MNDLGSQFAYRPTPEELVRVGDLPTEQLPSISVVVPSYNQGEFVKETIESIFAQNYPRLEVFVADGGSQDGTAEILKDFQRNYPKMFSFYSEADGGQVQGVNKAIANTSGEIIAWINSDDVYAPDAFWKIATFFYFNRCALVVYGKNQYVDASLRHVIDYPLNWSPFRREQERLMLHQCVIAQPSAFFRRTALCLGGPSRHGVLDYELWLRWQRDIPFFFIDELLSYSRLHEKALTAKGDSKMVTEMCRLVHDHYLFLPYSWAQTYQYVLNYGTAWARRETPPITPKMKRDAWLWWAAFNIKHLPQSLKRLWGDFRVLVHQATKPVM
jgi:glycosyltransferase involved in cell wall biosynthesis